MSKYNLMQMAVGPLGTNCYILVCQQTNKAAVIDPGGSAEKILSAIKENGWEVVAIINTHGHFDHVIANKALKRATNAPLYIHQIDAPLLQNIDNEFAFLFGEDKDGGEADILLQEGDTVSIGQLTVNVIHTPGHTEGGICLLLDQDLICGDTLFAGSIGRTDLPGGDFPTIIKSIKEKLMVLPDDIKVYPGHGPSTSIGEERRHNPYLR